MEVIFITIIILTLPRRGETYNKEPPEKTEDEESRGRISRTCLWRVEKVGHWKDAGRPAARCPHPGQDQQQP